MATCPLDSVFHTFEIEYTKMIMWVNRRNAVYNPLCSAEILNHIKGVSCEQNHVDLYMNDKCVAQPDLNVASKTFGSSCCAKNTNF